MTSFSASLRSIGDRKGLPATVHLDDDRLSINAGDHALGEWPLSEIHLEPIATGYRLDAEGEQILIELDDTEAFEMELHKKPPARATLPSAGNLMKSVDGRIDAAERRFGGLLPGMGVQQNHVWSGHWDPSTHGHPPRSRVDAPSDSRSTHSHSRGGDLHRHHAGLEVAPRSHDPYACPVVWRCNPRLWCLPRDTRQLGLSQDAPIADPALRRVLRVSLIGTRTRFPDPWFDPLRPARLWLPRHRHRDGAPVW